MTGTHVDLGVLLEILREADAEEMLAEILQTFADEAPKRMRAVEDAAGEHHLESIRQAAHAYKSSARQIGAVQLGELLAALEHSASEGSLETALAMIDRVRQEHANVLEELAAQAGSGSD